MTDPNRPIVKGRTPISQHADILAETENALVRLRNTRPVVAHLVRKYGCAERTAKQWIKKVKDRWREEGREDEQHASRRDEMRVILNTILAGAMTHSVVVKDKNGDPVLDPVTKAPVTRVVVDREAALKACAQLRALDALDVQQDKKLHITGDLGIVDARMSALEEVVRNDPTKREALRLLLEAEALAAVGEGNVQ